jgi:hypothetical protein
MLTFSLKLLLSISNTRDFRVSIDHSRDGEVVDVRMLSCNVLSSENTLLLSLMGKHSASNNITNSQYTRHTSLQEIIYNNAASLIDLYSCLLQTELLSVRLPSSCNQDVVTLKHLPISSFYRLNSNLTVGAKIDSTHHFVGS